MAGLDPPGPSLPPPLPWPPHPCQEGVFWVCLRSEWQRQMQPLCAIRPADVPGMVCVSLTSLPAPDEAPERYQPRPPWPGRARFSPLHKTFRGSNLSLRPDFPKSPCPKLGLLPPCLPTGLLIRHRPPAFSQGHTRLLPLDLGAPFCIMNRISIF